MNSHLKSVVKTFTWRCVGAVDSFVLSAVVAFLATGVFTFGQAGAFVGAELVTKSVLFYLHERTWCLPGLNRLFS